jgi:hyaluronate lyase
MAVAGSLLQNGTEVGEARDAYANLLIYVTSGDGFYTDGSFIQHASTNYTDGSMVKHTTNKFIGGFAYNNGYGLSLLDEYPPTLQMLQISTSYTITNNISNLYAWVYNTFEPVIYKGGAMSMFAGRGVTTIPNEHYHGENAMEDILRISSFAPAADAARMQAMVKYWAQSDTYYPFLNNCSLPMLPAAEILMTNSVQPRGELTGNYNFPNSDRMVHLKAGFGFGISMYSSRRFNYESINNENYKGWHQGDGATYLYNTDLSQFGNNYWWTVNPYRLPGTTVDAQQLLSNSQYSNCISSENWTARSNCIIVKNIPCVLPKMAKYQ